MYYLQKMMLLPCFVGVLAAGAPPTDELKLFKLPEGVSGGRCCDGSPAAWYYGNPANKSVTEWVFWLEGGGACKDRQKCHGRNRTGHRGLMTSDGLAATHATGSKVLPHKKGKPPTPSKWILSDDPQGNPDFFHAHKVYIHYCSSDEFAGTQTTVSAETFGFYFSGHLNLVNIFGELKKENPETFASASRVLFAGSSAGGIGVIHNIDWVRAFFPSTTVVKGAPLGGWFFPGNTPDQPNTWDPPSTWSDWSTGQVTPWDAAGGQQTPWNVYVNPACAQGEAKKKGGNVSNCISAHVKYPYIKAPMYVTENNYDINQLESQLGFSADNHSEVAQDFIKYFGRAMRNSTAQIRQKPDDGLFLASCFDHTGGIGLGPDPSFDARINGKAPGALLGEWFYDRLPASDRILVDDCGELPCNPTCIDWPGPAPSPPGPAPAGGCRSELTKDCPKATYPTEQACATCAKAHEPDLEKAHCKMQEIEQYCALIKY